MSIYQKLGIDPDKASVREIFSKIIDNEYPGAFVNIITDPFCPDRAMTQHQDGDGSKSIQRLLHYYESGNPEVLRGMVDDALAMNTGDIAASGFVFGPWIITDVLNQALPKDIKDVVMKQIAIRFLELKELYCSHGFDFKILGGETADLPDQVRSMVFDIGITAWANKSDLIKGNVMPGDLIFGFPSDGQAKWEEKPLLPIMSNGLTMARSQLMDGKYNKKYPELKREGDFYCGNYDCDSRSTFLPLGVTVGEAIISPTRQWPLVIRLIMEELKERNALDMLHGISLNTGGGATKVKNLGQGICYIKNMPSPPGFFQLIQNQSHEDWKNMYQSFNCGVGIDVVGSNNQIFVEALKTASEKCGLELFALGMCRASEDGPNEVILQTDFGSYHYF